jgi:16S rRNA (cytidine1402-2'-O)-methyltransferase
MTKIHEEFIRGRLSEILHELRSRSEVKGECTLLVSGRTEAGPSAWEAAREDLRRGLRSRSKGISELAREVAHAHGMPRQAAYAEALKIKAELTPSDSGSDSTPND